MMSDLVNQFEVLMPLTHVLPRVLAYRETSNPAASVFYLFHQMSDVEQFIVRDIVDKVRL